MRVWVIAGMAWLAACDRSRDTTETHEPALTPERFAAALCGTAVERHELLRSVGLQQELFEDRGIGSMSRMECGDFVVLRAGCHVDWTWLVAAFHRNVAIGAIEVDGQKGYRPELRLVPRADGTLWLSIRRRTFGGSGASCFHEIWWEVAPRGVREILSYPVEGYVYGWPTVDRRFDTEVTIGAESVSVQFRETFENQFPEDARGLSVVWTSERRAVYAWDGGRRAFRLDVTSTITAAGVDGLFGADFDGVLRDHAAALLAIARGEDAQRVAWLRRMMRECSPSAERQRVLDALR